MRHTGGTVATLAFAVLLLGAAHAQAQSSAYMNVPGVDGDSTSDRYKDWIELMSVAQSFTGQKGSNACAVHVTKPLDRSGPKLWAAAVTGQVFPEVRIEIVHATAENQQRFYELILGNAVVSSISSTPSALVEQLAMTGTTATLRYYPQSPSGELMAPVSSTITCK